MKMLLAFFSPPAADFSRVPVMGTTRARQHPAHPRHTTLDRSSRRHYRFKTV